MGLRQIGQGFSSIFAKKFGIYDVVLHFEKIIILYAKNLAKNKEEGKALLNLPYKPIFRLIPGTRSVTIVGNA